MSTLKRKPNWPTLLHQFVHSRRSVEFAWGANDCALFVADAINQMTGTDLGAGLRGQYSSLASASMQMNTLTGKTAATVEDVAIHFATAANMLERRGPLYAQRGDVVLFDTETEPDESGKSTTQPAMGILYLDGKNGVFVSQEGLNKIPLSSCRRAWQVG